MQMDFICITFASQIYKIAQNNGNIVHNLDVIQQKKELRFTVTP